MAATASTVANNQNQSSELGREADVDRAAAAPGFSAHRSHTPAWLAHRSHMPRLQRTHIAEASRKCSVH